MPASKHCRALFFLTAALVVLFFPGVLHAAANIETKDTDHNGKPDTWITTDEKGKTVMIADDNNHPDGKPHHWCYFRDNSIYKREWDRNFDGKADLRIFENKSRMTEKDSDDNFDEKFETKTKVETRLI